jgi:hypothetical protein
MASSVVSWAAQASVHLWQKAVAGGGAWRSCPAARRAFTAAGGALACAGDAFAAISFIGWGCLVSRWASLGAAIY